MKVFGIIFLVFAIIYVITIVFVKKLIDEINREYSNKKLELLNQIEELRNNLIEKSSLIEDVDLYTIEIAKAYEDKLKEIENKIKEFRGKQIYRNIYLYYNEIEEILNKKELSSKPASK